MTGYVLLIDENALSRKLVGRFLGSKGIRVVGVSTGGAAEAAIADGAPALVLVDFSLPGEDGLLLVRRLRETRPEFPIVAFTARAMLADRERALAAGCRAFLSKPVDLQALLELARQYVPTREVAP